MSVAQYLIISAIRIYRAALSPVLTFLFGGTGLGCRYTPTCSEYGMQAITRHGVLKGTLLTLGRLGRCHPWGGHGTDPVPELWTPFSGRGSHPHLHAK